MEASLFGPDLMGARGGLGSLDRFSLGGLNYGFPGLFNGGGFLGSAPSVGVFGRFANAFSFLNPSGPIWAGYAGVGAYFRASPFANDWAQNLAIPQLSVDPHLPSLPTGPAGIARTPSRVGRGGRGPSTSSHRPSTPATARPKRPEPALSGLQQAKHSMPTGIDSFIKSGGDGKRIDQPIIKHAFEEHGKEEYVAVELKYGDSVAGNPATLSNYVEKLRSTLNSNKKMILVLGDKRFSSDAAVQAEGGLSPDKLELSHLLAITDIKISKDDLPDGIIRSLNFKRRDLANFTVNTNADEHYYVDATREEGEDAIRKLTANGNNEDAWVYADYTDSSGKRYNRWFECGVEETTGTVKAEETFLVELANSRANFNELSIYHQHPMSQGADRIYPPSGTDIVSTAGDKLNIDHDERVVTGEGVYVIRRPAGFSGTIEPDKYEKELGDYYSKNRTSRLSEVVRNTGLNCYFRYFNDGTPTVAVVETDADRLKYASQEIKDFYKEYAAPDSASPVFDVEWTKNKDMNFSFKEGVENKRKKDVIDRMKGLFSGHESVYLKDGRSIYSFKDELSKIDKKREIKPIADFRIEDENEATEPAKPADPEPSPAAKKDSEEEKKNTAGPVVVPARKDDGRPEVANEEHTGGGAQAVEVRESLVRPVAPREGSLPPRPPLAIPEPSPEVPAPQENVSDEEVRPVETLPESPAAPAIPSITDSIMPKTVEDKVTINGMKFDRNEQFSLNTNKKHYFVDADFETGQREIREIAQAGADEELWIYVEYKDASGIDRKRWFERGTSFTERKTVNGVKKELKKVKLDDSVLKKFLTIKNISRIVVNHQHPNKEEFKNSVETWFFGPSSDDARAISESAKVAMARGIDLQYSITTIYGTFLITVPGNIERTTLAKFKDTYDRIRKLNEGAGRVLESPEYFCDLMNKIGCECKFEYFDNKVKNIVDVFEKMYPELYRSATTPAIAGNSVVLPSSADVKLRIFKMKLNQLSEEDRQKYNFVRILELLNNVTVAGK